MHITLTGRKIEITDSLRSFAEKKIKKSGKFLGKDVEARVVLSVEKLRHSAEVTITSDGFVLHTEEVTDDMYASIDKLTDKIETLAKKHRERITSKKAKKGSKLVPQYAESDVPEKEQIPEIVSKPNVNKKSISKDDAAERLHLSADEFIMFRNIESNDINVMYKKDDGNLGLIEP